MKEDQRGIDPGKVTVLLNGAMRVEEGILERLDENDGDLSRQQREIVESELEYAVDRLTEAKLVLEGER